MSTSKSLVMIDTPESLIKCNEAMIDMSDVINEFVTKMAIIKTQMKLSIKDERNPDVRQCVLDLIDNIKTHVDEAEDALIETYILVVEDWFPDEPFWFPEDKESDKAK